MDSINNYTATTDINLNCHRQVVLFKNYVKIYNIKFTILTIFKYTVSSVKYIHVAQQISRTFHLAILKYFTHSTLIPLPLLTQPLVITFPFLFLSFWPLLIFYISGIFSRAYWSFIYLLWRNVYLSPFPILIRLFIILLLLSSYISSLYVLDINPLSNIWF